VRGWTSSSPERFEFFAVCETAATAVSRSLFLSELNVDFFESDLRAAQGVVVECLRFRAVVFELRVRGEGVFPLVLHFPFLPRFAGGGKATKPPLFSDGYGPDAVRELAKVYGGTVTVSSKLS